MSSKKIFSIMGILNLTPDSFSDSGKYHNNKQIAIDHALEMSTFGADIIDIGGESTKPGAEIVDSKTEWNRIGEVVKFLSKNLTVSVDTYKYEVMQKALDCNVKIINNVDNITSDKINIFELIKKYNAQIIVTHNARNRELFNNDVLDDVVKYFDDVLLMAHECGLSDDDIILDVGIGFGKTAEQNFQLLRHLDYLINKFNNKFLLGTSKKSFLAKTLKTKEDILLNHATIATNVVGYSKGCRMFRVHDVLSNVNALKITQEIYG